MKFEFKQLPYDINALEPVISARTLEIHHGKHHKGYLDKLESAVAGKPEADMSLEQIIKAGPGEFFNNAAQVWNHNFYWESMRPPGGPAPDDELVEILSQNFGSLDSFKQDFSEAASSEFGSGWVWLVIDASNTLKILSTTDAENPIQKDFKPLLTMDVWEHAYYLDYQNERARYVEGFMEHLVNWEFIANNLRQSR